MPGVGPLLITAVDSDDGGPQLRAKAVRALSSLLVEEGEQPGRRDVRSELDSAKPATLIVGTLEGSPYVE